MVCVCATKFKLTPIQNHMSVLSHSSVVFNHFQNDIKKNHFFFFISLRFLTCVPFIPQGLWNRNFRWRCSSRHSTSFYTFIDPILMQNKQTLLSLTKNGEWNAIEHQRWLSSIDLSKLIITRQLVRIDVQIYFAVQPPKRMNKWIDLTANWWN